MERLFCALLLLLKAGAFCKASCPNGTFRPAEVLSCQQCRVCDRTLIYKQKCTETTDAVCGCAHGYSCGGTHCGACECALGQERTIKGCQNCPEKTFNDRTTGQCRPWRKCPGDKIREPGTEKRDVVCWSGSEIPPTQPSTSLPVFTTTASEWGNDVILITSAFVISIFLFAVSMLLAYFFLRSWVQKKVLKPFHGQIAQEVDDCTYRYPEEEEGGGSGDAPSSLKGGLLETYYPQHV